MSQKEKETPLLNFSSADNQIPDNQLSKKEQQRLTNKVLTNQEDFLKILGLNGEIESIHITYDDYNHFIIKLKHCADKYKCYLYKDSDLSKIGINGDVKDIKLEIINLNIFQKLIHRLTIKRQ